MGLVFLMLFPYDECMSESFNMEGLPEEIIINEEELQTNTEGKQYLVEEDGVFYGGDYLPKPPAEINLDEESLPPPPPEVNHVL